MAVHIGVCLCFSGSSWSVWRYLHGWSSMDSKIRVVRSWRCWCWL